MTWPINVSLPALRASAETRRCPVPATVEGLCVLLLPGRLAFVLPTDAAADAGADTLANLASSVPD